LGNTVSTQWNYSKGKVVHSVKEPGEHTLKFEFGNTVFAYNTASTDVCDEGSTTTTCNITQAHLNISDGSILNYNNLVIRNGGSIGNATANCSGINHGCSFVLNLTGNLTFLSK